MAVENLNGANIITKLEASPSNLPNVNIAGGRLRRWTETVEVSAAASATSTYVMARLPANAVLSPLSKLFFDDLASTGLPTLDIGLSGDQITTDDDALNDGIDPTSAGSDDVIKTPIDTMGQELWDYVNGQASNPHGQLDVVVTIKDAATDTGGTMTLDLYYTID